MTYRISLNGTWQLTWYDGQRGDAPARVLAASDEHLWHALSATVPGEIHLDLMAAGLLAEPAVGLNCLAARWVVESLWIYRRMFTAPRLAEGEHAFLTFMGLDLAAAIYLNGQEVGRHNNSFYPCRIDVTGKLQAGQNVLVVVLDGGLFIAGDRPSAGYGMTIDAALHKRNWLRKVQSSFGWDWSTRLINVGIIGDVSLEIYSAARFEGLAAIAQLAPNLKTGTVTVRAFIEGRAGTALTDGPQDATLSVTIPEANIAVAVPVTILPGLHPVETTIEVSNPQLWWPAGHGEQPLYTVQASVTLAGQTDPIGSATRRVGFRHVRVNQDPHPAGGSYFIIEINGKPIFIKGGNFVPADMIYARLDRARYATLVDRALEANFNMLRIWGGGLYESDDLYEICDERGVLLWQEFIFACAKYPVHDEKFLADVKQEATYQVRRLANHPSLVVWCGNNEMEEGAYHWNFDKGVAHPDYALFHLVLPVILKQEDGSRYYQPSSPFSPGNESPRRDDMGDQHPWTIGFGDTDFRKYRQMTPRFPNEGGILGSNSLPTTLACLPEGQRYPHSLAWRVHDNGVASWGGVTPYPDTMLENWLGKPIKDMCIEDYVYWAGVVQGEGLTEYIRNFRRRMFDTSSAIFWMYNDCWPTTRSWTVVDYYLRRTPSFHPVRRAFAPLAVALAVEDDRVRVYGVNEGPAWGGGLRYGVFNLAGGTCGAMPYPIDASCSVSLPANASTLLAEFPLTEWTRLSEQDHAAFAILSRDGREVARDRLFLPLFREIRWPAAQVSARRENGSAVFASDAFAWRVCVDLDGDRALPDNFFDVFPGIPTVIDWPDELGEPRVLRIGNMV